jgi:uncharacterized protein (DUF1501 family)
MAKPMSRRSFLRQVNCAAVGSSALLNTLLNLKLANNLAAQSLPDNKALVCIFLSGGCDAFNVLVPFESSRYATYAASRGTYGTEGGVGLDRNSLLPLAGPSSNFALHPSCVNFQQMANGTGAFAGKQRLAFIANLGTLIQPITKAQFNAWENGQNSALPVPRSLFSHLDQMEQWQTALPQGISHLNGWLGRASDILNSSYNNGAALMNISLGGNNILQVGNQTQQFVVSPGGSLTFSGDNQGTIGNPLQLKNIVFRNILEQHYTNLLTEAFSQITKESDAAQQFFQQQFTSTNASLGSGVDALFAGNALGPVLKAVVQTIKIRSQLGLRRQTFFVNYQSWDHHEELVLSQANMLSTLDSAIGGYQRALEQLGLANDVVTFTASDFGRSLRSNGRGTDHAWGSNAFVFGAPVDGGKIFGTYPDVALGSGDDVGFGGRFLPSTSIDVYFAELLRWFGIPSGSMSYVLPNISNFWNPASVSPPLGFIRS